MLSYISLKVYTNFGTLLEEKTVTKFSDCLLRCQNLCEILCFLGNQSKKVTYVPWEHKLKI